MSLDRQPEISRDNICPEFFKALAGLAPTLEYMWHQHECNDACLADVQRQLLEPVIEYKLEQ